MSYGKEKGTSKSTTARRRIFKFDNANQMYRFVQLYSEWFVPYADCTLKEQYNYDSDNKVGHYEDGWYAVIDQKLVCAKMEGEDFNKVVGTGLFRKEQLRRNTFMYVYEG